MENEFDAKMIEQKIVPGKIFPLIGSAMAEIGAIGKDSKNDQQGFMYRGIDAVYNALNPVMAKHGIFICPEVLDQKREERTTKYGSVLIYTILTIRYTVYAPDGSYIQMIVVGEGMDSGDKSTNKAMSVAMKYAMFQLFMIPTEEMKDPDAESFNDVLPRGQKAKQPEKEPPKQQAKQNGKAEMSASATVPPPAAPKKPDVDTPYGYMLNEMNFMALKLNLDAKAMGARFQTMRKALIAGGLIEDIEAKKMTMEQAKKMIGLMYSEFLDDAEKTA